MAFNSNSGSDSNSGSGRRGDLQPGTTLLFPGFFPERGEDDAREDEGAEGTGEAGGKRDSESLPDEAADIDAPDESVPLIASQGRELPFEKLAAEASRWDSGRIVRTLESMLFVADKPLTEEAIRRHTGLELRAIRDALKELLEIYAESRRGIVLCEVAGGWQLRTSPESADVLRRFLKVRPGRLTRAALETLAIVAYRQPVTRAEIEDIRAVDSGAVLKALLERRLIKIVGKRDEPGRPLIYGTTREFLEFFSLKDLSALPTLREFQELSRESEEIVERELGPEAAKKGVSSIVQDLRDTSFEETLKESSAEADAALSDLEDALLASDAASRGALEMLSEPEKEAEEGDDAGELGE